jgi:hypothetical protein
MRPSLEPGYRPIDPTTRRRLLTAAACLIVVGLGAEVAASRIVDRSFVHDRLADGLGDEDVRVDLSDVSFSLFRRRIEARGVVISRPGRFTFSAPRVVVSGVPLFGGEGVPVVRSLALDGPLFFVHRTDAAEGSEDAGGDERRPGPPALRIRDLRITEATLLVEPSGAADDPDRVLVRDLRVEGREVAVDAEGRLSGIPGDLAWSTGELSRTPADGLTRLLVDSLRASAADSSFLVSGIDFAPTSTDAEFFRQLDERRDRIRATIASVRGRGVDLYGWMLGDVRARAVELDSADVDVLSNRRLPPGSGDPWLPTRLIRSFGGEIRLDTVHVSGRIAYNEIPARPARDAARMEFEQLDGRVTGISSAADAAPIVLEASMSLFEAPATIRIEIPYDSSTYRMQMSGTVGAIDLTRVNSLTVPLQGIEVQDGRLAALRFAATVDGRTAGGTVWAAYRDLDVQIVDRETGEGGLFDDIKSFVTNTFVLRGDNMPGDGEADEARPGAIEYFVRRDDSFFTRVWAPIRSGLMAVARG